LIVTSQDGTGSSFTVIERFSGDEAISPTQVMWAPIDQLFGISSFSACSGEVIIGDITVQIVK
jgi:hypothetical protein